MCGDGACVSKDWACDGVDDCVNGTDEDPEFCAGCPFKFLCTNGRCTDLANVCDGRNQCRDNSDEDQVCVGKCQRLHCQFPLKKDFNQKNLRCLPLLSTDMLCCMKFYLGKVMAPKMTSDLWPCLSIFLTL